MLALGSLVYSGFGIISSSLLARDPPPLPVRAGRAATVSFRDACLTVLKTRAVASFLVALGLSLVAVDRLSGLPLVFALAAQGFFAGGVGPVLLTILMDLREVGAGIYFAVGEVGGFSGPSVMGLLKDLSGGFTDGLLMLAAITVVMLLPTALLRDPRASG